MLYIDVSHYDWDRNKGNLDWQQIKSSGINVVIIRATYGDPQVYNPQTRYFQEMATAAKAAGLRIGGYHNLIHGDFASIQRQVAYFKSTLDTVQADYAMVDIEPYQALKDNDLWPRLADAELFAQEFSASDPDRKLMVYLPQWVWSNWLERADLQPLMEKATGPLVSSNYPLGTVTGPFDQLFDQIQQNTETCDLGWQPYGNVTPEIWQYSSNAIVPGASSTTDVNAFQGTIEEFETRMAWVITRNLQAFRDQMNKVFPNRDKKRDGAIGDYAHQQGKSGHNPDDTQYDNAEWDSDSDTKSEVRAIDVDSDTGDSNVSMEDILQHLLKLAKSDKNFPIRYMIYNKRIYKKNNGWAKETYTGPSPHTEHLHLSGDYSNTADENYYDYRLGELVALTDAEITKLAKETAAAVWEYKITDYADTANPKRQLAASTWMGYSDSRRNSQIEATNARAKELLNALAPIAAKVDLDPNEIKAIADAIPTAEENAAAVISALGQVDTVTLVNTLKDGLSDEQIAALKAAL